MVGSKTICLMPVTVKLRQGGGSAEEGIHSEDVTQVCEEGNFHWQLNVTYRPARVSPTSLVVLWSSCPSHLRIAKEHF